MNRRRASRIRGDDSWIGEETFYAYDAVTFNVRTSEHVSTTITVPKGWSMILLSPDEKKMHPSDFK